MFNSVVLDVVIGLVFIYLLYSLLATILQELISTDLSFRSKMLERALLRMLEDGKTTTDSTIMDRINGIVHLFRKKNHLMDKKVAAWFYAHPLIKYLGEDNYHSKPAYISSQNFSKVIVDLLRGFEGVPANDAQRLSDSIQDGVIHHLPIDLSSDKQNPAIKAINSQNPSGSTAATTSAINPDTKLFLQSLWLESGADIDKFRQKLERWFDDTMERASGWYKRYTRLTLFVIGLILAIGFNVDTITLTKRLSHDPKLRDQLVQSASAYMDKNKQLDEKLKATADAVERAKVQKDIDTVNQRTKELLSSAKSLVAGDIASTNNVMGLGWGKGLHDDQDGTAFFGWLITALAISLGAPFWFDMLNKLMKLRGTGPKIDDSNTLPHNTQTQPAANTVSVSVNSQTGEEAVG